jgi:hypothetical protein
MEWQPLREERLIELINEARTRMNPVERRFWDAISINPEKWEQVPYGVQGGGFWAVAILGKTVVWYNDIEDGFNYSSYERFGTIPTEEYWCNQDELEWPVRRLMRYVDTGQAASGRFGPPAPGEYTSPGKK